MFSRFWTSMFLVSEAENLTIGLLAYKKNDGKKSFC